jgi:hypothetical protein
VPEADEIVLPKGWATTHSGPEVRLEYAAVLVNNHASVYTLNEYYKDGWYPFSEAKVKHATLFTLARVKS